MRFVAIETSTEWCSVALWDQGEIAGLERRAGNRHSELALPMLQKLLGKNRLDAVAFGAGPGAFTGLRIACGLAQGIAFGRAIPVIGVSTLEAMAQESGAERAVACIDARMREVYYAALEKRAGRWHEVVPAQCVAPHAAPPPPGDGWVGVGSGFEVYREELKGKVSVVRSTVHPTAVSVAILAAPRLAAGQGVDAAEAAPVYLRDKVALTQAELGRR
jgi:tRNA threonylcarbamoyladenosine biosynthesis protein TsaB